jgi:DNA repair ATPase RecN
MDSDPIKRLQSLFTERSKVLETISSIHSALDSVRAHPIDATTEINAALPSPGALTTPFPDDPVYGRFLQALREMQTQIDERIRPLAQEMVQFEVVRLRDQSDDQQDALKECLAKIDQSILDCLSRMDEYQSRCADLTTINHRLSDLGATREALPPELPTANLADAIAVRLEGLLRLADKI